MPFTIRTIAVLAEDANHRSGDSYCLFRAQQQSAVGGELLVSRDSAEQYAEIDPRGNTAAFANRTLRRRADGRSTA